MEISENTAEPETNLAIEICVIYAYNLVSWWNVRYKSKPVKLANIILNSITNRGSNISVVT